MPNPPLISHATVMVGRRSFATLAVVVAICRWAVVLVGVLCVSAECTRNGTVATPSGYLPFRTYSRGVGIKLSASWQDNGGTSWL